MCARQWPVWGGGGPSWAIPIPRGTRAVPGRHRPGSTSPAPVGGFRSFQLLLAIPSPCPERAGGAVAIRRLPRQLGGCRCGPAAADLHVCLYRATSMFLHIPPQGCQHVALSGAPSHALAGALQHVTQVLSLVPRAGGFSLMGWLSSTRQVGNLWLPFRVPPPGKQLWAVPLCHQHLNRVTLCSVLN